VTGENLLHVTGENPRHVTDASPPLETDGNPLPVTKILKAEHGGASQA
jgi:hypothetical protein